MHVKPGKGAAFVRVKNIINGGVVETISPQSLVYILREKMQYLHNDGASVLFHG